MEDVVSEDEGEVVTLRLFVTEAVAKCKDVNLLDLIYRLLIFNA